MSEEAPVNTGAVAWPDDYSASVAVRRMQTKLHRWAIEDPGRRFGDLHNLVYDPAFLAGLTAKSFCLVRASASGACRAGRWPGRDGGRTAAQGRRNGEWSLSVTGAGSGRGGRRSSILVTGCYVSPL